MPTIKTYRVFPILLSSTRLKDGSYQIQAELRDYDDDINITINFNFPINVKFIAPFSIRGEQPDLPFEPAPPPPEDPPTPPPPEDPTFFLIMDETAINIANITPELPFDTIRFTKTILMAQLQKLVFFTLAKDIILTLKTPELYPVDDSLFNPFYDNIPPNITTIIIVIANTFNISSITLSEAARSKQIGLQAPITSPQIQALALLISGNTPEQPILFQPSP